MDQPVQTTDAVVFASVNTGHGDNELYAMDQNVRTIDSPTFSTQTLTSVVNNNSNTKLLTLDGTTNVVQYRDSSTINPFNQTLNTGDAVVFTSVNTGQGANSLYAMNQAVRTTDPVVFASLNTGQGANQLYAMNQNVRTIDSPTFVSETLTGVINDNTTTKILTLDGTTNLVKYRTVASLPNPFNQSLNTGDAVTFATINTGQGANELYAMDQNVRTIDSPTFSTQTLTGVANENTNTKLLTLNTSTNVIQYRESSTINPFNQTLNTTDAVTFTSLNTGQGPNKLYAMNQNVRITDAVIFDTVNTGQGANKLYQMDQNVRTVDSPTFSGQTLTGVAIANSNTKMLTLNATTNLVEYRDSTQLTKLHLQQLILVKEIMNCMLWIKRFVQLTQLYLQV